MEMFLCGHLWLLGAGVSVLEPHAPHPMLLTQGDRVFYGASRDSTLGERGRPCCCAA